MRGDVLRGMLLIEEPSVLKLYHEMMNIAGMFVAPVFMVALIIEFFDEMNFSEVVRKLLIVTVFMSFFYQFHQSAAGLALSTASETLQKVSPRNIFVRKWHEVKLRTKEKKEWSLIEKFATPYLNDFVATAFFLLAKVFLILLKLIYSTVYHFTYVFSGITAVLYFLGWTKNSLKGTVQGSLWCMLMPFVLVGIMALVGNSFEESSSNGELVLAKVDTILWLFGVTLLMLLSPLITYGMVNGEGIQSFGSKMGQMVTGAGMKALSLSPMLSSGIKNASQTMGQLGSKLFREPSIKDLLRKDSAGDAGKMKMISQKGGLKNPLSPPRSLDERLAAVGMTKDEAKTLSRLSGNRSSGTGGGSRPMAGSSSGNGHSSGEKNTFQYDPGYWNSISSEHQEGIRKKYGLPEGTPASGKVFYPVNSGKPPTPTAPRDFVPGSHKAFMRKMEDTHNRGGPNGLR